MKLDEIVSFSPISRYINIEIRYNINETRICIKCISTKIWIRLYMFLIRVFSIHLFFALACMRSLPSMFIYSSDYYRKTNTRIFDFVKSFFEIGNIIFKISTSEHVYSSQKQSNIRGKIITSPIFLSNTLSYLSTRILEFAIEFSKTCDINYNYRVIPPAFTQRFSGSRWNTVSKSSPAGYV